MWLAYGRSAPVDMGVASAASDIVTTPIPGTSTTGRLLLMGALAVLMLAVRRARPTA
jgi:hypothetical protein